MRIRRSVSIRLGLSAQEFAFPAPTGIVDFALYVPGDAAATSLSAVVDTCEKVSLEVDTTILITHTMAVSAGIGLSRTRFYSNTEGRQAVTGLAALWWTTPQAEIQFSAQRGQSTAASQSSRAHSSGTTSTTTGRRMLVVRIYFDTAITASNLMIGVRPGRTVRQQLSTTVSGCPRRTLVDVGGRYRFNLRGHPATLRVAVSNVTDEYRLDLRSSGAYDTFAGRVEALSLNLDF